MPTPAERATPIEPSVSPPAPSLLGTILGGLGVSVGILAANRLAERLELSELDLPRVLGLTFRDPEQDRVQTTGLLWYFAWGGAVVPTLYWLGFRAPGRTGARAGFVLGIGHYLVSGAILGASHPDYPKQSRGPGRPMGLFDWCANLAGHIAYGLVVGWAAATAPIRGKRRSRLHWTPGLTP